VRDAEPTAEALPAGVIIVAAAAEAAPAGPIDPEPAETVLAAPPPGIVVANVILPPYATPQPGPTPFTGFIRCAGRVTYYI
jgi:hypothetical protein